MSIRKNSSNQKTVCSKWLLSGALGSKDSQRPKHKEKDTKDKTSKVKNLHIKDSLNWYQW